MKNITKTVITLGLIGILIMPTAAFADTTDATTGASITRPEKVGIRDRGENPPAERPQDDGDKPANLGRRLEDRKDIEGKAQGKLDEIITLYSPDLLDEFQAAVTASQTIKESINTLNRDAFVGSNENLTVLLTSLSEQLKAGSITRDEAKAQIVAYHEAQKDSRDDLKTELNALRESYGISKENQRAQMDALRKAIDAEDDAAITAAVASIIESMQNHTAYEQAVYNLLNSK